MKTHQATSRSSRQRCGGAGTCPPPMAEARRAALKAGQDCCSPPTKGHTRCAVRLARPLRRRPARGSAPSRHPCGWPAPPSAVRLPGAVRRRPGRGKAWHAGQHILGPHPRHREQARPLLAQVGILRQVLGNRLLNLAQFFLQDPDHPLHTGQHALVHAGPARHLLLAIAFLLEQVGHILTAPQQRLQFADVARQGLPQGGCCLAPYLASTLASNRSLLARWPSPLAQARTRRGLGRWTCQPRWCAHKATPSS